MKTSTNSKAKSNTNNLVIMTGKLLRVHTSDNVINFTVGVENEVGISFIPCVIFKSNSNFNEYLEMFNNGAEIEKYDKNNYNDFKSYIDTLEDIYIEGEISSNTYKGNTTIQVVANLVK